MKTCLTLIAAEMEAESEEDDDDDDDDGKKVSCRHLSPRENVVHCHLFDWFTLWSRHIHCFRLKNMFSQGHSVSSTRGQCEAKTSQTQELHHLEPQSAVT